MGEDENKLDSGRLYFNEPDGTYSELGEVTDFECVAENNDISEAVVSLHNLEASFTAIVKTTKDVMLAITGIWNAVMNCCPDKRVVHLALHAKKGRTRKKNRNRVLEFWRRIE